MCQLYFSGIIIKSSNHSTQFISLSKNREGKRPKKITVRRTLELTPRSVLTPLPIARKAKD